MTTNTEIGDRIIGDTIICEARQIRKKTPYSQKRKAQNSKGCVKRQCQCNNS